MAQIATTIEQSKKFKGLGIDVDSADMSWHFTNMRTESLQWELKTVPLVTKENFFGKIEKLASPFYKHADGSPLVKKYLIRFGKRTCPLGRSEH